jgi:hypothetical protein
VKRKEDQEFIDDDGDDFEGFISGRLSVEAAFAGTAHRARLKALELAESLGRGAREVGPSPDGRVYSLPNGQQVDLLNCGPEIVAFMIEKWQQSIRDVPVSEIEERLVKITGINVGKNTRLRDRVGNKRIWYQLMEKGSRSNTVRLKYPPVKSSTR